jgi:hypothetical protein
MRIELAIYSIQPQLTPPYVLVDCVPKKNNTSLFSAVPFDALETEILPTLDSSILSPLIILQYPMYYLTATSDLRHLMVIYTRDIIDKPLQWYLFRNMQSSIQPELKDAESTAQDANRPTIKRVTLAQIYADPLFYATKDRSLDPLRQDLEDLRDILIVTIDQMLNRGVKLTQVDTSTFELKMNSKRFRDESIEVNRCCRIV